MDPSSKQCGSAHRPRLGTTVALYHRGQSLLQEFKKETTSKALCISGWLPLGHADPAKNVTMQRIYLACLRFCLHVALALIHRRLPQTTWTCQCNYVLLVCVFFVDCKRRRRLSVCSFTCNANTKWPIPKTQVKLKAQFAAHLFFFVGFAFILTVTYTILAQLIMYYYYQYYMPDKKMYQLCFSKL